MLYEFEELVVLFWIDASAVSVLVCGNALPVRTLEVPEAIFCSASSTEPSPKLADTVLPLAYVDPLHDTVDMQFPSVTVPASGLGGLGASPFALLPCCHFLCCSLWIPSLFVEVLVNGRLKIIQAPCVDLK